MPTGSFRTERGYEVDLSNAERVHAQLIVESQQRSTFSAEGGGALQRPASASACLGTRAALGFRAAGSKGSRGAPPPPPHPPRPPKSREELMSDARQRLQQRTLNDARPRSAGTGSV